MSNNTDMMGDDSDGAMRRATIVVCANSGTEVPRYGVRVSATNSQFVYFNPAAVFDEKNI